MATARFEDLIAWQRARQLQAQVFSLTAEPAFARDWALVNQMRRAAISVTNNIAEGYERERTTEFAHYLLMAKGSASEVRSMLYACVDNGFVDETRCNELRALAAECSRIISGLRHSVLDPHLKPPSVTSKQSPAE